MTATCATGRRHPRRRHSRRQGGSRLMAEYANPAALVSTQWVADHLNDPNVRLIEVDVDTAAYDQGHIQGAVGVNWTTQLGDPIRRDIPSGEAWANMLVQAGVSPDTR